MKILLTTLNAKYIHKNLALRWLYVASPYKEDTYLKEFTIKEDLNFVAERIVEHPAEIIAFSTYIWNISETRELVRLIKLKCKKHIILGGPEVSYDSFELLDHGVNALSLGEGEVSFWKYITMLRNNEDYEIDGICTNKHFNKKIVRADLKVNETYDDPYFLDFDLKDMGKRYFYFETSRGCPYGCEYCLSSTDRKVRNFSDEYIYKILEKISKSDIKIVKLLDRTFNISIERALKMANFMNDNCKNQIFQFEIVAETLDERMIDFMINKMDKSRFRFEVGVQSFNQLTLESVNRKQDNEKLKQVIKRLSDAGIVMHCDLIAGLPYENLESFQNSFNTLFDLRSDEVQLGTLKLLKGTSLNQKVDEYGFNFNISAPYDVLKTKWLSEKELIKINQAAYALEKTYNNGMARNSINTLLRLKYAPNAFSFFMQLGEQLKLLSRPYAPQDLFMCIKKVVSGDSYIVDAILKDDYFRDSKQKPKIFLDNPIDSKLRKEINEFILDSKVIDQECLYHYVYLDNVYIDELGYQVVVYNKMHTKSTRYFIDLNLKEIKQI